MQRFTVAIALLGATALVVGAVGAEEPKKALTLDEVKKQMKATHRGDKAPHARVVAELKKEAPDWKQLAKDAKAFEEMGRAFKGVKLDYASPAGYIRSATALTKAVGDKDRKAANDAFTALTKSCAGCHSYGGPATSLRFDKDGLLK